MVNLGYMTAFALPSQLLVPGRRNAYIRKRGLPRVKEPLFFSATSFFSVLVCLNLSKLGRIEAYFSMLLCQNRTYSEKYSIVLNNKRCEGRKDEEPCKSCNYWWRCGRRQYFVPSGKKKAGQMLFLLNAKS